MPPVLGLTLAAAAILTSIGGDSFRERLAQLGRDRGDRAPIIERLSAFIFAMVVQIVSLLIAIVFKAKPFSADWLPRFGLRAEVADWVNFSVGAIGCLFLIYGILLILGAAFSIRAVAVVYVRDARREADGTSSPSAAKSRNRGPSRSSKPTAKH